MKWLAIILALALLAACVQIPEEELQPAEPQEEAAAEPTPVAENKTEPLPLAPLPEPVKNVTNATKTAVMPKSVPANSTTTAPMKAGKANVPQTWTTESLSIAEGETKYIYVKE
jgi:hypothetical protein